MHRNTGRHQKFPDKLAGFHQEEQEGEEEEEKLGFLSLSHSLAQGLCRILIIAHHHLPGPLRTLLATINPSQYLFPHMVLLAPQPLPLMHHNEQLVVKSHRLIPDTSRVAWTHDSPEWNWDQLVWIHDNPEQNWHKVEWTHDSPELNQDLLEWTHDRAERNQHQAVWTLDSLKWSQDQVEWIHDNPEWNQDLVLWTQDVVSHMQSSHQSHPDQQ